MKRGVRPTAWLLGALTLGGLGACRAGAESVAARSSPRSSLRVAQLDASRSGLAELSEAFRSANPGYDLEFHGGATSLARSPAARVLFVQRGEARGTLDGQDSDLTPGDVVLLRPGQELTCAPALDLLAFSLPGALPGELPGFVRPDWDPRITDQPGGCATETGAYRRILLTWLPATGPYQLHALNAHRVRIQDSFTHYHPRQGGFDELYLVQAVQPGARLLSSDDVAAIEARDLGALAPAQLFDVTPLRTGDLVYLPRGTIHRGLGGVLAQVIAVPGFVPGTEIGVDEHLRALNARLALAGPDALPVHTPADAAPGTR